ncbi:MAG TPA: hypothetical protein VLH79_04805 [Chthonomonadales bacterium]|nr:hypothetical protein [Chthonomonadales bacterium]
MPDERRVSRRVFIDKAASAIALPSVISSSALSAVTAQSPYAFSGPIPRQVLERYLERSLQYLGLCSEGSSGPAPHFDDNLRLIREMGARFIGRASYAWDAPVDDEQHYRIARENAARVHAQDPEVMLQACVFETAYSNQAPEAAERLARGHSVGGIEDIPVPEWVFREYGAQPERRNFRYDDMLYPDGRLRNHWLPGASVPDITRRETQYWFYYRARRYIDAGHEAIHFGQVQLVGQRDEGWRVWADLVARVRRYAASHARRRWVVLDGHFAMTLADPGIKVDGRFLWDFLGFPLRPVETAEPLGAELRAGHLDAMFGRVPGGLHPAGWTCDEIPQLYEVDNCHTGLTDAGSIFVWGADESTWLANLPDDRRRAWLRYAHRWVRENTRAGHFQMPGRRPATTPVTAPALWSYIANNRSASVPDGFGDEGAMRAAWDQAGPRPSPPRAEGAARRAARARLLGRWRPGDAAGVVIPNEAPSGQPGRLVRRRSVEWYAAMYRVHGGRQSEAERARGAADLRRLEEATALRPVDSGLAFDGSFWVDLGMAAEANTPAVTLRLRLRAERLAGEWIVAEKHEWLRGGFYIKYHEPERSLYGEAFDGEAQRRIVRFHGFQAGRVHDIALVADGRMLRAWLDGRWVDEVPAGPVLPSTAPLLVGRGCSGVWVGDVRLWGRAATEAELRAR